MSHLETVDRVRAEVRLLFEELGTVAAEIQETILIRDGHYCGRRFTMDACQAVWFVEENQIKVYDSDGHLARTLDSDRGRQQRQVA